MVMVRGVFPGRANLGDTLPFPLFSSGICIAQARAAILAVDSYYADECPASSPMQNRAGKMHPLPCCECSARGHICVCQFDGQCIGGNECGIA